MAAFVEVNQTQSSSTESASTLRTVVDLVRRIMQADVASIVTFSFVDHTVTWKALSGFRSHVVSEDHPLVRPIANGIAQRLMASGSTEILQGIGISDDLPASEFPVHAAEGVQAVAISPIGVYGGLIAGYRSPHSFTDDEKKLLRDLAEMAALALDNARLNDSVTSGQSRMRALIESAMDAVILTDAEQRVVLFNPAAESMFGCTAAEALGSFLERFIPRPFRDRDETEAERADRKSSSTRRIGTLSALNGIRTNGEEFPIEASISVSESEGQKLFTVIVRDITERRRAENALRDSEERYRELFENANDVVYSHDLDGRVSSINKAGERLSGYARAELMKMNMSDLLVPASRQSAEEMLERKLSGQERTNYEVEVEVRDGKLLTLEISSRLIMKEGEPVGVQGIARDISDRKLTEVALRESEERARRSQKIWEQTFDAIGEGIMVYDQEKLVVRCNARAAEMMEMRPAAVVGLSFNEAFARLFGRQAAAYYLEQSREGVSAFEVRTEGGRLNLVSIFPVEHPDGKSLSVVTLNDVTRLSEMQEQLGRSRRLASVGQLAAGVAHEINNPLAAITTCAEATMRDLRQTSEVSTLAETRQWNYYLEEIVRQALRCKEITRGLLDLTRQRRAQRTTCDINLLVKQCAKVALQRAGSAIEVGIDLDNNVGEVATDASMVRQILDNLLSNAIDALGDNEGKMTVSTRRDSDRIALEVRDTGSGIPAESLSRIFDPFFSMKGPGKGYGLGLAISSTLAETLGGAITVESKQGEGSRFSLWLPRRAPEEQSVD